MELETIKSEYFRMRGIGMDAKTVLTQLRPNIVRLEMSQREKLLEQLRVWEISNAAMGAKGNSGGAKPGQPVGKIKPLTQPVPRLKVEDLRQEGLSDTAGVSSSEPKRQPAEKVACPHCGKMNARDDVFCYSCGQLLTMERGLFDTRHFLDTTEQFQSDEFYGPGSTLALVVKESQATIRIRPQEKSHEVIIGRGAGSTMKPDIDLTDHKAAALGVSRMHLSISYNEKQRTLSASDMGSANGTFINGQRLHPGEIRVLRHGDELRVGKLPLLVYFYHTDKDDNPLS